jgi:hypothetical protein
VAKGLKIADGACGHPMLLAVVQQSWTTPTFKLLPQKVTDFRRAEVPNLLQ